MLTRSATRDATRIYQFVTNNQASFHLWYKEKLVKHQNSQNIMTMVVEINYLINNFIVKRLEIFKKQISSIFLNI